MEQPYKKFIDKINVNDWEIETDHGFVPIKTIGKTIPYDVYLVRTETGKQLRCADTHILFDTEYDEIFVKDLNICSRPDYIQTIDGPELIEFVAPFMLADNLPVTEHMYDIEVDSEDHRYYTNGLLSHNSIFLCNDAVNFVKAGKNVVFITCEMSAKKVIKRMGANMLDINIDIYDRQSRDVDYISKRLTEARQRFVVPPGRLFIREYPTSCCTTIDVENYIKQIQEINGFKVDVVVIDYINIMSNYRSRNSDDMYIKIKQISEDLRAIAVRQECLVLTATQTNRGAFDTPDVTMSNIAESAGLIHTADTMFGIIQDADMRIENRYLIKILKIRDGEGKNNKMEMHIEYKKMKITETGRIYKEDSNEPIDLDDAIKMFKNPSANSVSDNLETAKHTDKLW